MKIQNYIRSIKGIFTKDELRDNIRNIGKELDTTTVPAYHSALTMFRTWSFKSAEMKAKIQTYGHTANNKGGNIIVAISDTLDIASDNLRIIEKFFESTYNEDVAAGGMTFVKVQVQQFIDAVGFVSRYGRKFLQYAVVCETAQYQKSEEAAGVSAYGSPVEIKWIDDNWNTFLLALNCVGTPTNQITKLLSEIPDIVVTDDNVDVLASDVGEKKLDPFRTGLIPVNLNPFYLIGMMFAEWQANSYKVALEELKLLQLRKLNLEKLKAGKEDLALQKQIDSLARRIADANYRLSKMGVQ
jgi:hypothetical protein